MANNRVEKHKEYRTKLIHEGTSGLVRSERVRLSSTETLPFDTVMETVKEENYEVETVKKQLKKKYLTITLIVCGAAVLLTAIGIIAVFFFKR